MWEIKIEHQGLHAYRVVKGTSKEEAELKANLQISIWNGKYAASTRTKELQGQTIELKTLLKASLEKEPFSWEDLKHKDVFSIIPPIKPVKPTPQ